MRVWRICVHRSRAQTMMFCRQAFAISTNLNSAAQFFPLQAFWWLNFLILIHQSCDVTWCWCAPVSSGCSTLLPPLPLSAGTIVYDFCCHSRSRSPILLFLFSCSLLRVIHVDFGQSSFPILIKIIASQFYSIEIIIEMVYCVHVYTLCPH